MFRQKAFPLHPVELRKHMFLLQAREHIAPVSIHHSPQEKLPASKGSLFCFQSFEPHAHRLACREPAVEHFSNRIQAEPDLSQRTD
jgi:hypothetical protein